MARILSALFVFHYAPFRRSPGPCSRRTSGLTAGPYGTGPRRKRSWRRIRTQGITWKARLPRPVPNPGYSETLAASWGLDGYPTRSDARVSQGDRPQTPRNPSRSICRGTASGLFVPNPPRVPRLRDPIGLHYLGPQLRPGNGVVMNESFKLALIANYCS